MNYDVSLEIDTGGESPYRIGNAVNYTSTVHEIWEIALGDNLAELDGKLAKEVIPLFEKAVKDMWDNPEVYKPMEPSNGWGDLAGARQFLQTILDNCRRHPKAIMRVSVRVSC